MSEPDPHAVVVGGFLSGLVQPGGAAVRTVQGDLYLSATTAMLFFAGALLVALIIIALLTLRHSPNPLITSTSKETLS